MLGKAEDNMTIAEEAGVRQHQLWKCRWPCWL